MAQAETEEQPPQKKPVGFMLYPSQKHAVDIVASAMGVSNSDLLVEMLREYVSNHKKELEKKGHTMAQFRDWLSNPTKFYLVSA